MESDRKKYLDRILNSDASLKLVAAGAGTGKTYTFKELLNKNPTNNLALTFINNLVNDMKEDLKDVANVCTFHSFCKHLLHKNPSVGINTNFHFFPKLEEVVCLDADILNSGIKNPKESFEKAFQNLDNNTNIDFFIQRANYYNAVGFNDSVYRVLEVFNSDPSAIPKYNQIVIDEFQDFNLLEVSIIRHLIGINPTLIAGDDDQAIYDRRFASSVFLRNKYHSANFENFLLPYCSRCTQVIIDSVAEIIKNAKNIQLMKERINKKYECYTPDKQEDNSKFPKIIRANCSVDTPTCPYISKYIEKVIRTISPSVIKESHDGGYPTVLVIGPGHYIKKVHSDLSQDFENTIYKPYEKNPLNLLDSYGLLLKDTNSNLAWRVIANLDQGIEEPELVEKTADLRQNLINFIPNSQKEEHLERLKLVRNLVDQETALTQEETNSLTTYFSVDTETLFKNLKNDFEKKSSEKKNKLNENKPSIQFTTYNGCKGLSAAYTFILGFEEGQLPKFNSAPTENEVCKLIVAITRTRKQCHLVHARRKFNDKTTPSIFLDWFPTNSVSSIYVNKEYLQN
jgi:superfamily I DNA/RNA helicase